MLKSLSPEIIDVLKNGTSDERKYLCKQEPVLFGIFYFPEFFSYQIAPFHYEFFHDIKRLMLTGEVDECAWIAFRESAKTSIAKIGVLYAIAYGLKRYINYDSYEKENAEQALFDIVLQLQTNKLLIQDFGQLFHKKRVKNQDEKEAKLKRINNFITENNIKVEAFSTQESTRGRVFNHIRPDFYVLDDIETSMTIGSYPVMGKIKRHVKELKAGLGVNGSILYLGNYITEDGVIDNLLYGDDDYIGIEKDPKAQLRFISVRDKNDEITWKDKYVETDAEAAEINATITNKLEKKVSLADKEIKLGKATFATEMMNNPAESGNHYFDLEIIRELKKKARPPVKIIGQMGIWAKYSPKHRYGVGGDTAEGIGRDACALGVINFSTRPARLVATFADNEIKPDVFAWDLKRAGDMFGECVIIPEINNTGYATVAELVKPEPDGGCGYKNVYTRRVKNKKTNKVTREYGFRTTRATKPDIFAQFKSAVEDGDLEILDIRVLEEMERYGNSDIHVMQPVEGMTRHFDLLTGCVLAWEANKFAIPEKAKSRFKSPQKKGEYEF